MSDIQQSLVGKNFQRDPSVPNSIGEDCRYLSIFIGAIRQQQEKSRLSNTIDCLCFKNLTLLSCIYFHILLHFIAFSLLKVTTFSDFIKKTNRELNSKFTTSHEE